VLLRSLGLVYLVAFLSLWVQIDGLAGRNGILPAEPFLAAVSRQVGTAGYWLAPTLCWISSGDGFLHFLCGGGAAVSLLLMIGIAPAPCLIVLWAFYLSLTTVCRTFLSFQWDALLLEAGFLAVFLAPWRARCRLPCPSEPPRSAWWLMRWLVFRLHFSSGVVKLASGDATWRGLTALEYHYQTQPLPAWTSWYVHQLPGAFQKASVLIMFFAELAVPFLVFAPRRPRLLSFWMLAGFQAVLAATGNYAFFNLLTVALCVAVLDDGVWPARFRERGAPAPGPRRGRLGVWAARCGWAAAAVVTLISVVEAAGRIGVRVGWPAPLEWVAQAQAPFRVVNAYGLFAAMTTTRPEIIVEGSNNGTTWLPYEFKWKPGTPSRPPRFVAPHQPRLDWQMWFAALSECRRQPWLRDFLVRLLQGSPEVLALMEVNPFPEAPPRYIRAVLYDYAFTNAAERRATGDWWRREIKGLYCPVVSLPRREPAV